MPPADRTRIARRPSWKKILLIAGGCFVLLAVIAVFALESWVTNYLRSESFRQLLSRKTGEALHGQVEFGPLRWTGSTMYSDGFTASGGGPSLTGNIRAEEMRADIDLHALWERAWRVDAVELQKLRVDLTVPVAPAMEEQPAASTSSAPGGPSFWAALLPNRFDLRKVSVQQADLVWPSGTGHGQIKNSRLLAESKNGGWDFAVAGGTMDQAGFGALNLDTARLRYRKPQLFITEANLRDSGTGTLALSGEVDFEPAPTTLHLLATLNAIRAEQFLKGDWRARINGGVTGEVKIEGAVEPKGALVTSGSLHLVGGSMRAFPVLDAIALFTQSAQFREIPLNTASADFSVKGEVLQVTNFRMESENLLRVEGGFTVTSGQMDGKFQVGIAPGPLRWLPGGGTEVFTVQKDGYLWTPVTLSGPASSPHEDLTARLTEATANALLGGGQKTLEKAGDTLKDAASSVLDLFKSTK